MSSAMRVIVAGSPDWPYPAVVQDALTLCADAADREGRRLTVVHGNGAGAERDADEWALWANKAGMPVTRPQRFTASWGAVCVPRRCRNGHRRTHPDGWTTCPSAGYYRNEEMVAAGAELWLAFLAHDQRGVQDVIRLCVNAGIEGQEFPA